MNQLQRQQLNATLNVPAIKETAEIINSGSKNTARSTDSDKEEISNSKNLQGEVCD